MAVILPRIGPGPPSRPQIPGPRGRQGVPNGGPRRGPKRGSKKGGFRAPPGGRPGRPARAPGRAGAPRRRGVGAPPDLGVPEARPEGPQTRVRGSGLARGSGRVQDGGPPGGPKKALFWLLGVLQGAQNGQNGPLGAPWATPPSGGPPDPARPPDLGPLARGRREAEKCTFFWVFNNSPSRDRFRPPGFWDKIRGGPESGPGWGSS